MGHTPKPWKATPAMGLRGLQGVFDIRFASDSYIGQAYKEDDARLIAAAPDLLEACKAILPHILTEAQMLDEASVSDGRASDFGVASMKVRRAIMKAELVSENDD